MVKMVNPRLLQAPFHSQLSMPAITVNAELSCFFLYQSRCYSCSQFCSFQDSIYLNLKNSIFSENPSNKIAHNTETWVLDTEATDHIIHSISLFTSITSSLSSFVHLPNGERVLVTHIGTVQLTPTLIDS